MSDDDYPLDPSAYTPDHAHIHHSRVDSRQVILDLTRERDEARAEVERLRAQQAIVSQPAAAGCVCPAGANQYCANQWCPRRNPPGIVTRGGGR